MIIFKVVEMIFQILIIIVSFYSNAESFINEGLQKYKITQNTILDSTGQEVSRIAISKNEEYIDFADYLIKNNMIICPLQTHLSVGVIRPNCLELKEDEFNFLNVTEKHKIYDNNN